MMIIGKNGDDDKLYTIVKVTVKIMGMKTIIMNY